MMVEKVVVGRSPVLIFLAPFFFVEERGRRPES